MPDSADHAWTALDLERRARVFFHEEQTAGPIQLSSVTLLQGWHFEESWHRVVLREDSRNIVLDHRLLGNGRLELTVLACHYQQSRFPLFHEEDITPLSEGQWQGMSLEERWHDTDSWQGMLFHQMLVPNGEKHLMKLTHPMSHPVVLAGLPESRQETLTFLRGLG